VPISEVFDTDRLLEDFKVINDRNRPRPVMALQAILALLRNFRYGRAPHGLGFWRMLKIADGHTGHHMGLTKKGRHEWRVLLVAGMWFQDLFNYDFRRTENVHHPPTRRRWARSPSARTNTGVGWRKIVETMHMNATTASGSRRAAATRSTRAASRCRCPPPRGRWSSR